MTGKKEASALSGKPADRASLRPVVRDAVSAWGETSALLDPLRLRIWDLEGLTVTQLRLLFRVAEQEGLSNAELADRLLVTRPSVSALLDRLERGGFIRREVSPNDRRGISIWLEDRGWAAINVIQHESDEYMSHMMDALSDDELVELARVLGRLVAVGRVRRARDLEVERQTQA